MRSLSTALSLRYPLHSAGDPFQNASGNNPGLQLSSIINCLPLSPSLAYNPGPIEAIPSDAVQQVLTTILTIPLSILRSVLPILRSSHDPYNAPCTVINCYAASDRYLGTPFSGSSGAFKGIISNAAAQCLDVLRRELSTVEATDRRPIKVVNVDVGFLLPVQPRRTHRGQCHDPAVTGRNRNGSPNGTASASDVVRTLPQHLRAVYAPALAASLEMPATESGRRHLSSVEVLSHKLLKLVLSKSASNVPDRTSVGAGGESKSAISRDALSMRHPLLTVVSERSHDLLHRISPAHLRCGQLLRSASTPPDIKPSQTRDCSHSERCSALERVSDVGEIK